MTDANGRVAAIGDYAAKVRTGTITAIDQSAGTYTVTFQDGSIVTYPSTYIATFDQNTQPPDTWWFQCIQKHCGA